MATPLLVQNDWSAGMKQDQGFEDVPDNAAWLISNMLPGVGGFALGLRGPIRKLGSSIQTTSASFDLVAGLGYLAAASEPLFLADSAGRLVSVNTSTGSMTTRTALATAPPGNAVEFNDKLIFPQHAGSVARSITSTYTVAAITGSPPEGRVIAVYKGRLVLANSIANKARVWFSGILNENSWDTSTTGNWVDMSHGEILGLGALSNALLVFTDSHTERIRGDTPGGGGLAGDLVREPLFDMGTSARPIVAEDKCFFANPSGVFMTDGAALVDLTLDGGMRDAWTMYESSAEGWSLNYLRGWLFVSSNADTSASGETRGAGWMINTRDRSWFALEYPWWNAQYGFMLRSESETDEAWVGARNMLGVTADYVFKLSGVFDQGSDEGIGDDELQGFLNTRPYLASGPKKRFRRAYFRYQMTDATASNPRLAIEPNYEAILEQGENLNYPDLFSASIILLETNGSMVRKRDALDQAARSVAFSMRLWANAVPAGLQTIELEAHEYEGSRL